MKRGVPRLVTVEIMLKLRRRTGVFPFGAKLRP
jgi:hypothetical protein